MPQRSLFPAVPLATAAALAVGGHDDAEAIVVSVRPQATMQSRCGGWSIVTTTSACCAHEG